MFCTMYCQQLIKKRPDKDVEPLDKYEVIKSIALLFRVEPKISCLFHLISKFITRPSNVVKRLEKLANLQKKGFLILISNTDTSSIKKLANCPNSPRKTKTTFCFVRCIKYGVIKSITKPSNLVNPQKKGRFGHFGFETK